MADDIKELKDVERKLMMMDEDVAERAVRHVTHSRGGSPGWFSSQSVRFS